MITCAKTPQLHLLPVLDLLGITIPPFYRYIGVCVCVDKDIECAVPVELWEEGYGGGDLSEDRLDFGLDFLLRLFERRLVYLSVDAVELMIGD